MYTDIPRGSAGYCAYHASGTVKGIAVQFAFFWKLDGDSGCDPLDTQTGHSQGLGALANVSGHELSEARSDPSNGGWYDAGCGEIGDKCAWTFNVPSVAFSGGTKWKVHCEWSNSAYRAGTGYPEQFRPEGLPRRRDPERHGDVESEQRDSWIGSLRDLDDQHVGWRRRGGVGRPRSEWRAVTPARLTPFPR